MTHLSITPPSHNNNLTALRWIAALLVLYGHAFVFLGLPEPVFLDWQHMGHLGILIFFSISGYLVAQSWENDKNIIRFIQRRALRIFPGLIACILITVFALGPILTNLTLHDYIFNDQVFDYLKNIVLYINFNLPGVFIYNHYPNAVNGSLWSLPIEFFLYITLAIFGLFRFQKLMAIIVVLSFMAITKLWAMQAPDPFVVYRSDVRQIAWLGIYFWIGIIFFKFGIKRYFSQTNTFIAIILWLSLSRWPEIFTMASWIIIPFLALSFGLTNDNYITKMTRYDYSYGIYIYAFPIQQTVVSIFPEISILPYLLTTGIATIIFAGLSWHLIEKPAMTLKPRHHKPPQVENSADREAIEDRPHFPTTLSRPTRKNGQK